MACTPDPEDSWPLWNIATHKLKSPEPGVPSDAGTRRDKAPSYRSHLPGPHGPARGPCSPSQRGRWGRQGASARTSSARPDSRGGPSRAKHAERSGALPSSAQAAGNTHNSSAQLRRRHRGPGSPLFCTRSGLEQLIWFVLLFLRSRAAGEGRADQTCFSPGGVSHRHSLPVPRLTALPARQPPPVHADPVEPAQRRVGLHALALRAGVLLRAPAGHTRLVVRLGGHHAVALRQGPSQSKEKNLEPLPRKNSTRSQATPPAPGKTSRNNYKLFSNATHPHSLIKNELYLPFFTMLWKETILCWTATCKGSCTAHSCKSICWCFYASMFENPVLNHKIILKTDTYICLLYFDCVL